MNQDEKRGKASETDQEDAVADCAEQFRKLMEQCGSGCRPMMAKMMAAMASSSETTDCKEKAKCRC